MSQSSGLIKLAAGPTSEICSSGGCPTGYMVRLSGGPVRVFVQGDRVQGLALPVVPRALVQQTAAALGRYAVSPESRFAQVAGSRVFTLASGDFMVSGTRPDEEILDELDVPDHEAVVEAAGLVLLAAGTPEFAAMADARARTTLEGMGL